MQIMSLKAGNSDFALKTIILFNTRSLLCGHFNQQFKQKKIESMRYNTVKNIYILNNNV